MKKIILIKLGGSLITEKDKPYTSRDDVINQLAIEIKKIITTKKDTIFILGNGGGSFAHYPAKKYHIQDKTKKDLFGYAAVQDGAAQLNRIVVGALLKQGIPAVSLHPSSFVTASGGVKKAFFTDSLFGQLHNHLTPVIYGDIVFDEKDSYHIFSTEALFSLIIPELRKEHYQVEKIIHLTSVAGVLDAKKQIIPLISQQNFVEVKKHIFKTKGTDVTGGMLHKIETALSYAKNGIPTYIIQGDNKQKLLTKLLLNQEVIGTTIV